MLVLVLQEALIVVAEAPTADAEVLAREHVRGEEVSIAAVPGTATGTTDRYCGRCLVDDSRNETGVVGGVGNRRVGQSVLGMLVGGRVGT